MHDRKILSYLRRSALVLRQHHQQRRCRRCTEEIQQAMRKKPKPNWNETVPPIINKHHKKIEALGVSLLEFVVYTGRLNRRFGVES